MIEIINLTKNYGREFSTLLNFNAKILSNTLFVGDEFVGSLSLMRLLSKIEKPTSGEILIDNQNLNQIKDKNLSLSYLPSDPILMNGTIYKNLEFPLKIRKIDKNSRKNTIKNAISSLNLEKFFKFNETDDFINLQDFYKLKTKNLTKSEKKIVVLLRAFLRKPKYVLLEHFFEDLDEKFIPLAENILKKLEKFSTIIACEKFEIDCYKAYPKIELKN